MSGEGRAHKCIRKVQKVEKLLGAGGHSETLLGGCAVANFCIFDRPVAVNELFRCEICLRHNNSTGKHVAPTMASHSPWVPRLALRRGRHPQPGPGPRPDASSGRARRL